MAILQPIHNIAEICYQKGIKNAILCPGSRSAALTISFVRHPEIETFGISDERSAAFIGLGIAQQTKKSTILVCTSGTAAYNFAPAIAEAFFQEIPLLVLTADRPDEWINQYDGQTIFQKEIYGKHVKKSYHLPADYSHPDSVWQIERIINEAINLAETEPKAPIHINIPIREPFYPTENEEISFEKNVRIIKNGEIEKKLSNETWNEIFEIWNQSERKLIAVGQSSFCFDQLPILKQIQEEFSIPILGDIISNIHQKNSDFISSHDIFLALPKSSPEERTFLDDLKPDLLITCGKSFISKNLKLFLRKNKPKYHFHIQENPELIDPFQTLTHKFEVSPNYFFQKLFEDLDYQKFREGDEEDEIENEYFEKWKKIDLQTKSKLNIFLKNTQFSDFQSVSNILEYLPENSILHLGNSMSVRYTNLVGLDSAKNTEVLCNRGTSGIEGSLSTAVGFALKTDKIVTCLLGDVSAMYDRNALWNNYLPKNLRIIVLNNHGGNIFRMIDGPSKQPELEEYFETKQADNFEFVAKQADIDYIFVKNKIDLMKSFNSFFKENKTAKLLEIETKGIINKEVFSEYKKLFAEL